MKVVIIGSGNTATVMARKIRLAGHQIVQVFSRTLNHAGALAAELECAYTDRWEDLTPDADCYLIAISDSALDGIGQYLNLGNKLVLHTAGSVSKEALKAVSSRYGVLYPLQSLRKEILVPPPIPLLVDANSSGSLQEVLAFAGTITLQVQVAGDLVRQKLHLAAVLSSNFSNHLYALTEYYCKNEGLDFKMLIPLLTETVERISTVSASLVQTGPAIRGDLKTTQYHLELIKGYPGLQATYQFLSKSIEDFSSPTLG